LKKNKNNRFALYAIIAVVLISALYFANTAITGRAITNTNSGEFDFSRGNPDYYSLLPPKPADFSVIQLMWQKGIISDDAVRINSSYWKQPEWFPNYNNFLLALESTAKDGRLPVWGLGIFDTQMYRQIDQQWLQTVTEIPKGVEYGVSEIKNNSIVVKNRFWIRAVSGTIKINGVRLSVFYPSTAYLKGNAEVGLLNETILQDSSITQKYIKAWALESETDQTEFNLGTYWPILSPDYIKEIEVTTEIDRNTPKGTYIVGVDMGAPSREYQQEQSLKYLLAYTDPNIGMFSGPNQFKLFIEVA